MSIGQRRTTIRISEEFGPLLGAVGFGPETVYTDPGVKSWRQLPDRDNCVWDLAAPDGTRLRMHVKRYSAGNGFSHPADMEAGAYRILQEENIPSAKLAAWGELADGRSFVMIQDLAGYGAADKLVQAGTSFDKLLNPTADLAARLHNAGLHHRDLYLCHFFAKIDGDAVDVRLIDAARVGRLPGLTRRRWIIKDLAQFWYSSTELPITDEQRTAWLQRYGQQRRLSSVDRLRRAIERKSAWIAAHDVKLRLEQPRRNISIPKL